jgi:parvulin-like peptidyl-prolyl isomerase
LWQHGLAWSELPPDERDSHRKTALEELINDRLIAWFDEHNQSDGAAIRRESEEQFQQFLKQFSSTDEWKRRMELQGLDERALRSRIHDETRQLDVIGRWLLKVPGKVTEAAARQWFDGRESEFQIPERVRASHIFLTKHDKDKPDRGAEIRELHRKLTAGESTFEELAAKNSEDDSARLRGGDLGWFTRKRVPVEFADKVFALRVDGVSAPFESHLGWHILIVKEKEPERAATFEEMKDEIIATLDAEWRESALKELIKELRSKAMIEIFESRSAKVEP